MLLLTAGFVLSLFGSIPPGLISLSVSQASISRGLAAALALAVGAAFAEFFQAWAAVLFTDWFLSHPGAERNFQWAAVPVFLCLGAYLIFFAKLPHTPEKITPAPIRLQFLKGMILSSFNLLAIPYWFVYCAWLRIEGWWKDGLPYTLIFAFGVFIGTAVTLSLYAWLGQLIVRRSIGIAIYANRLIGLIFLVLGFRALYGLMK